MYVFTYLAGVSVFPTVEQKNLGKNLVLSSVQAGLPHGCKCLCVWTTRSTGGPLLRMF